MAGRILERRHQFGEGLHRHRVLDHLGRPVVLPELDAQRLAVQAEHRLGAALVLAHDGQGVAAQQAEMLGRHAPAQALEGQSGAGQQGLPALPGVAHALQAAQLLRGVEESAVGVQLVLQRRGAEVAADIPRIADRHDAVGVGARVGAARPNNSLSARSSCLSSPCSLRNSRKPNSLRVRMIADCSRRDNFTSVLTETFTRSRSSVASNNLLSRFI
ncbi:hypothetical protein P4234_04345 [Pseudomonas aeruginosa]|nr:hypothetical protein [Pseudomonas aeruginosa]